MRLIPPMAPLFAILALSSCMTSAWAQGVPGDAFPAHAPPMPVCNPPREGVAACLGGRQCLCRFERGGSIAGRPDGYRWDCGVLRPSCAEMPAEIAPPAAGMQVFPQITLPEPEGWSQRR